MNSRYFSCKSSRRSRRLCVFLRIALCAFALFVIFVVFLASHRSDANILMYHEVWEEEAPPPPHLGMKVFGRQMEYLSRHGYATVFVSDMIRRRKEGKEIPGAWVALTFDGDGRNFYDSVYPALKRYKLKATLFVVTSSIGGDGATWEELREMRASGLVEIGSHSHRHLPATCLPVSEARNEKVVSKALLEKNIGAPIFVYAYPYGDANEAALDLVKEAGYMGGGRYHHPFRRI